MDNQRWQAGSALEKSEYAYIILLYSFAKQFMARVEYLWGKRTDYGGATGTYSRIKISVKYSFSSLDF